MLRKVVIFILLIAPMLSGATKYPLVVTDCRGKRITIPRQPSRIISTAPNNTEILFALGLGTKVVGVTKYCNHPTEASKKTKVGDRTISVEKVLALKPDLVLAHGTLNDREIQAMEEHGIRVVAIDPKTIAEVKRDILLIGKITNREKQAQCEVNRIAKAENNVKKRLAKEKTRPKVLVAVQADPLWAAGPKTFVDEMIRICGGLNAAAKGKTGFAQFSIEAAIKENPDVIIGMTKGDKQFFTKGVWRHTKACRTRRVYEADADLLVRPGPRLADGILLIARMVHPNVFGTPQK